MKVQGFSFLRPYLHAALKPSSTSRQSHIYLSLQRCISGSATRLRGPTMISTIAEAERVKSADREHRIKELGEATELELYPRLSTSGASTMYSPNEIQTRFANIDSTVTDVNVTSFGRVSASRNAGRLLFLDIERGGNKIQAMCNLRLLEERGVSREKFKQFGRLARKGDWYKIEGNPTRTSSGQLCIQVTALPECLAPSLHQIPHGLEDVEKMARYPHIKQLVHQRFRDVMALRHTITGSLRSSLTSDRFVHVDTPILEGRAGGATARAFETYSNHVSDASLKLRIAPELSLKRLIVGGQDRIFEIGRVFRNEGVDSTHNPEFTICEFYEVGANLPKLMSRTIDILSDIQKAIKKQGFHSIFLTEAHDFEFNHKSMQFLPFFSTLKEQILQRENISKTIPNLSSPEALGLLQEFCSDIGIDVPLDSTLPQLLELLLEKYIEPLCVKPTFITFLPECLSPLAKSEVDTDSGQRVAVAAELFINGKELVNCYEEENSPFEQRRKFEEQIKLRAGDGPLHEGEVEVDESYLEVLEWGMPPTGGWGCGVDRLVMLFSGMERIADVLPFGSLRNSAAMANNRHKTSHVSAKGGALKQDAN